MGEKESLGWQINQLSANEHSAPDNEKSNYGGAGYNLLPSLGLYPYAQSTAMSCCTAGKR